MDMDSKSRCRRLPASGLRADGSGYWSLTEAARPPARPSESGRSGPGQQAIKHREFARHVADQEWRWRWGSRAGAAACSRRRRVCGRDRARTRAQSDRVTQIPREIRINGKGQICICLVFPPQLVVRIPSVLLRPCRRYQGAPCCISLRVRGVPSNVSATIRPHVSSDVAWWLLIWM